MGMDPKEEGSILDEFMPDGDEVQDGMIDVVENTNEWTHWRDNIATEMYEEWRTSQNKRIWSDEETNAFVGFMEEFMVDGQRSNCGQFKPGTFEKLALKMLEAFSGCTLTAKHCKNKHKRLKEKYHKDVLDAWLKAHPTKFYSPGKPFPLFHWLEGIFGRDRATGGAAVSGFNAEEQVNEETEDTTIGFDDSEMSPQQELDGDPAMQGQASHFEAGASAGSTR
ncbi:hypothetical protein Ahy_A09g045351 [Arachis hypogaea]|uniref:Myb/SANT-like DNA-binding domain-containing protein n=1 Tax=Arachis hypogaea TaxID=3818 RepID=A0A445BM60_ARAHY|nr:hypothetical protein Ahy_A09g045351 [Arachis hypogaea]